jgi:hypothetical protein
MPGRNQHLLFIEAADLFRVGRSPRERVGVLDSDVVGVDLDGVLRHSALEHFQGDGFVTQPQRDVLRVLNVVDVVAITLLEIVTFSGFGAASRVVGVEGRSTFGVTANAVLTMARPKRAKRAFFMVYSFRLAEGGVGSSVDGGTLETRLSSQLRQKK